MKVVVNGLLTSYEVTGKGPVVLFIHGWGSEHGSFNGLVSALKGQFQCISLDLPGFGDSQAPNETWGIHEYAEFVASFIHKVDAEPFAVVGHSNGGTIAMYALSQKLLKPTKLVLLASAGVRDEDGARRLVYKTVAKVGKQVARVLPKSAQKKLRRKLYDSAGSDMFVSPHLQETFKRVVRYDVQKDASMIAQPALLIYADDDTETPVRYGQKLENALQSARLEVLPSGGHFVFQKQPDTVSTLMKDFLK